MPDKYERFVAAYLRLNAYFTVPNFIVHDADRVSDGKVGNRTETDIIGVRMRYSREAIGQLSVANHTLLVDGGRNKHDVVIAEVKSGANAKPNKVWHSADLRSISYIVHFVGLHSESDIPTVARGLAEHFHFEDEQCRFRYIVFSEAPNTHYQDKGVTYITFKEAITFVVQERGNCWAEHGMGVASCHHQWDELLIEVFNFANDRQQTVEERVERIVKFLAA